MDIMAKSKEIRNTAVLLGDKHVAAKKELNDMAINAEHEENKEGRARNRNILIVVIIVAALAILGLLLFYRVHTDTSGMPAAVISDTYQNEPPVNTEAPADESAADQSMALNQNTSLDPLPSPLWDDYYKCGVQVTDDTANDVWYVQSGKKGQVTLHGFVKEDEILVIDTYILYKDGHKYSGGSLLMLRGPLNLEKYKITIKDGAAQLVDPLHAQELLDYNIAVKFARGNFNQDTGKFSYKPWALKKSQIWTLDYTYHLLKLSEKTDNYPR
jgi:hypothetical protein